MAEGTRLTQAVKANEEQIADMAKESVETRGMIVAMSKEMQVMNDRLTDFMVSFNRIAAELKQKQVTESSQEHNEVNDSNYNRNRAENHSHDAAIAHQNIKIEFPRFDGVNPTPRCWIRKCQKYFQFKPMDDLQKVSLASIHLDEVADEWYQNFQEANGGLRWQQFVNELFARFEPAGMADPQEEFNKLQQVGTVSDYQNRFEALRAAIAAGNRHQPESYWISSFISGLKPEIKSMVRLLKPKTFTETISLARLQEAAISTMSQNPVNTSKPTMRGILPTPTAQPTSQRTAPASRSWSLISISTPKTVPIKRLSFEKMQVRRSKGLCYNCDEKFVPGHVCKKQ